MEHALAAAAFDAAIKALSDFPTFYYDARTGRYHSAATKKMVSFDAIQAVFHAKEAFDGERLTKIALAYKRGNLPANLWYQATLDQLRKWHIQQAALGAGGFGRLRPADYERIEQLLNEDRPRLERFARQIPTMGDGQIQYRINLYLGNGRRNYWRAKRLPSQARKPGYTVIERRVIQPGDNCFVAGTLISTPNGDVPIEQIREGQLVSTRFGPKRVVKCMTHMAQRSALVTVQTIGGSVVCTNNHPFLTTSGWVKAGKLGRNRIAVFSQDGTQQFRAQVTFPYAYYSEATSGEIGVLRRVALFLLQLTRAQRLEAGMPVPPFTINLNDEVAHLGIYNEFGLDEVVRFIGDVELVKVGEQPQFETGGFAALPLTHRLEQIGKALWVLPTALRFLAHSLCRTGQMGWIVGQHALGSSSRLDGAHRFGRHGQPQLSSPFPHRLDGLAEQIGTILGALRGIVGAQDRILFSGIGGNLSGANPTVDGYYRLCTATLGANFSRHIPPEDYVLPSRSYRPDETSILAEVRVYNFEVEDVHEYVANGFVVHNCEWCIHLADFGWQVYGVLPYPGEIDQSWYGHACLTNCRCKLERRYIKTANVGKYVKRPFMVAAYDPVEHGKAYEESDHPRDAQGRWADKPESALAPEGLDVTGVPWGYVDLSNATWERIQASGITAEFYKVTAGNGVSFFVKRAPSDPGALKREATNYHLLQEWGHNPIPFGVTTNPDISDLPYLVFPHIDKESSEFGTLYDLAARNGELPSEATPKYLTAVPLSRRYALAAADFVLGNPDRHAGNILYSSDPPGRYVTIDNAYWDSNVSMRGLGRINPRMSSVLPYLTEGSSGLPSDFMENVKAMAETPLPPTMNAKHRSYFKAGIAALMYAAKTKGSAVEADNYLAHYAARERNTRLTWPIDESSLSSTLLDAEIRYQTKTLNRPASEVDPEQYKNEISSIVSSVFQNIAKAYEESEHPRDERGRWTDKPGAQSRWLYDPERHDRIYLGDEIVPKHRYIGRDTEGIEPEVVATVFDVVSRLPAHLRERYMTPLVQAVYFDSDGSRRWFAYAEAGEIFINSNGGRQVLAKLSERENLPYSVRYAVAHEIGHLVHNRRPGNLNEFYQLYRELSYPGAPHLTFNAATNAREAFADAFATLMTGEGNTEHPFVQSVQRSIYGDSEKAYEESEHPRYPAGHPKAGQWMPKNGVPEAGTLQGLAYEVDPTKTPFGYMDLSDAKWERVKAHGITNFFFKVTAKDGKQYFAKALPVQKEALEREVFNHDVLTAFGFKAIEFGVTDLPDSVFKELKLRPEIWEGRGTEFAPMIVFPYMDTSGEAELQPLAAASGRFPAHGGNWNNMPIEEKMKLVVADFAIGNPDRHNDNIMVPIPDATENWEEAGAWSAQDLFLIDNAFFDPTDEFTQGRRRMGHTAILNGWEGGLDDPMESYGESQLDVPFADILADMEAAVADKPSDENWNYVRRGLHAMRYAFEPGATPYSMLYLLEGMDLAEAREELTGYDPAKIETLVDTWREAQESGEGDEWKSDKSGEFAPAVTYDTARAGQNVIEDTKPESEVGKAFDSNQPRYPKGDPEGRGGQWKPDSEPVPLIAREPVTYSPPRPDFDDFNIEDQPDPGLHMPRFGVEFVDREPPMVITPVDRSVLDSRFDAWIAKGKQEFGYPIGAVDLTKAKWEPINSSSMTGELYTVTEQDGTKWFVKGFNGDEQTTLDRELTNYTILKQSGFPVLPFGVTDNPNNPGFRLMAFPHLGDFDMFPMAHLGNSRRLQVLRAMAPETPLHVVAVDFALGNWDRHAGNVMVGRTGDWLLIDNAYVDNGAFDGLQRSAGRSAFITPFRTMPEQPEESAPLPPALVENIERMASMKLPEAMRPDQRMFWGYGVAFARFSARRSHTQGAFVRMMRAYSKWEVGEISRRQGLTPDAVRFFMQMKDHDENAKIDMDWKRYDEGGELWDILQSLEGLPVLKSSEELSPIDD